MRILTLAALLMMSAPAVAQDKRQLGAHEHGTSTLNVAIDGKTVTMELDAPGDDIVGFETEATTPKQKAAVEAAIKKLSAPDKLFVIAPAAGCKVTEAKVETVQNAQGHSGFEGRYTLTCEAPEKVAGIELAYFKAFPKADKVTVTVVTAKGQTKTDATPKKAKVSLAGVS